MALIVKSPRLFASIDREGVTPESLNPLLVKLRQPARDLHKFDLALQHSLLCITLRQVKDSTIVGFVRLVGDGIFNVIVWDFVVDPDLPQREAAKLLLVERLKREIRRQFGQCSVSVFASPQDVPTWQQAKFIPDQRGVRAMVLH